MRISPCIRYMIRKVWPSMWSCTTSVSYTHLDVYKRQRQDIEIYYSFVGKIDLPE